MVMNKQLQKHVIEKILKKHGIDADTVDLEAEIDSSLSLKENIENITKKLGLSNIDADIELSNAKKDELLIELMRSNGLDAELEKLEKLEDQVESEIDIHKAQIREYLTEIVKTDPLRLAKFIASNLKGEQYEYVRKAILLTIASDDRKNMRGRVHTLLIGPPGCGKSEILLWLRQHLNAYFVNAEYASKVGLAGDARGAEITPGVLAEADEMILCIDELDKMSWKDQNALLQAMEEGAYTIVKGKHRARFKARVRVVATANDINKIQRPLLDRFDFVITLNTLQREERAKYAKDLVLQFFDEDERIHADIVKDLLGMINDFIPSVDNEDAISKVLENYIKLTQLNVEEKSIRSLELSILRIANTLARISMTNVTAEHVIKAIQLKDQTLTNTQIAFLRMIAKS